MQTGILEFLVMATILCDTLTFQDVSGPPTKSFIANSIVLKSKLIYLKQCLF